MERTLQAATRAAVGSVAAVSGPVRRFVSALALAVAAVVASGVADARPAAAAPGERITSFSSDLVIERDGSLAVREQIIYDFGANQRHGIFRYLPDRFPCEGAAIGPSCPKDHDRVTPIRDLQVSMDGGSVPVKTERQGNTTVWRIGDADRTVTGSHVYEISYLLTGTFNPTSDGGAVLGWNATGTGWDVPFDEVVVTISAPTSDYQLRCVRGPAGSNEPCAEGRLVQERDLGAGDNVTVTLTFAPGIIDRTDPILREQQTLARAFRLSPGSGALTALTALLGGGLAWRTAHRGRDRRFAGGDIELAMGRAGEAETTRGVFEKLPAVMEFTPPNKIRPGQMGALVDERVDNRDVTATIVDLAIRGHLRIVQVDKHDWELTRLDRADDGLRSFESLLLTELFETGNPVRLSSLKQKWAGSYAKVRTAVYQDLVDSGWYAGRPDRARGIATAKGGALLAAGVAAGIALGQRTTLTLAAIPLVVAGIVTLVLARRAGARTAGGTAMAARSAGFKRLIETPTQEEMARFAERHDVFIEYLPFAIVFGCATQWAGRFAALGALPPPTVGWYVPLPGGYHGDDAWDGIAASVSGFAGSAGASLAAAAASGGSGSGGGGGGFSSGGGFGGGGGGSW